MPERTSLSLSKGEEKVLSLLIRRGGKTWTEILKETGLSKGGLSRILRKLIKYKLVEETLITRGDRKVKGYRSLVDSIREADLRMALYELLDSIDEIAQTRLTKNKLKELFSLIVDYVYFLTLICLERMFTRKKPSTSKISNLVTSSLEVILNKIREYPHMYEAVMENIHDLIFEHI